MTDEENMLTSEITALLKHKSPAATRSWIRNQKLEATGRDTDTGEKRYSRREVDAAIAAMPRGLREKGRPDGEPPRDHDRALPPDDPDPG